MDSYIVRIYQRDQEDPNRIAGLVELVENQQRLPFTSLIQLNEIIAKLKETGLSQETEKESATESA